MNWMVPVILARDGLKGQRFGHQQLQRGLLWRRLQDQHLKRL